MMEVTKLSWATVLIESKETYILIDPLGAPIKGQDQSLAAKLGEPLEPLVSLDTISPECYLHYPFSPRPL